MLARWTDSRRGNASAQSVEEQLYLTGPTAKRLTLAFNGLAADWYWMRSLQYVGGKVVAYEDAHAGQFDLQNLSSIDLRLLPSLLRVTTTLDPQFIPAYEYGAVILPEVNPDEAVSLLKAGIAANPSSWRLYQHLGYIYWQKQDYQQAADAYAAGGRISGAPGWMTAMAARMKAEGGSSQAAREMYQHLYDSSNDTSVRSMVEHQLMRLDSLDERAVIRQVLQSFEKHSRDGRCPLSWRDVTEDLRRAKLRVNSGSGAPLDPTGVPYLLRRESCDVELDPSSKVPR